jgi:hypothetical protein
MCGAGVANEDRLDGDGMRSLAVGRTSVDGVHVVETLADGVSFDELITHL